MTKAGFVPKAICPTDLHCSVSRYRILRATIFDFSSSVLVIGSDYTYRGAIIPMPEASPGHQKSAAAANQRLWSTRRVCRTLLFWYPELLSPAELHPDMRDRRAAMEFVACLQEYRADLQDLLILLAQRSGIREAALALDNAIRKELERVPASSRAQRSGHAVKRASEALTAQAS